MSYGIYDLKNTYIQIYDPQPIPMRPLPSILHTYIHTCKLHVVVVLTIITFLRNSFMQEKCLHRELRRKIPDKYMSQQFTNNASKSMWCRE